MSPDDLRQIRDLIREEVPALIREELKPIEERLTKLEVRLGRLEARFDRLEQTVNEISNSLQALRRDLEDHGLLPPEEATG